MKKNNTTSSICLSEKCIHRRGCSRWMPRLVRSESSIFSYINEEECVNSEPMPYKYLIRVRLSNGDPLPVKDNSDKTNEV